MKKDIAIAVEGLKIEVLELSCSQLEVGVGVGGGLKSPPCPTVRIPSQGLLFSGPPTATANPSQPDMNSTREVGKNIGATPKIYCRCPHSL